MKPVYQTRFGGPEDDLPDQGNCFPAALASILNLSLEDLLDLPYTLETDEHWEWYLADKFGLGLLWFENDDNFDAIPGHTLVGVDSKLHGPDAHVAVAKDGTVVHDPNEGCFQDHYKIYSYGVLYSLDPAQR